MRFRRKLRRWNARFSTVSIDETSLQQRATALVAFTRTPGLSSWGFRRQRDRIAPGERSQAANRVIRGGSWNNNPRNARSANRNRNTPENRNNNLGFRLALAQRTGWIPCRTEPTASLPRFRAVRSGK